MDKQSMFTFFGAISFIMSGRLTNWTGTFRPAGLILRHALRNGRTITSLTSRPCWWPLRRTARYAPRHIFYHYAVIEILFCLFLFGIARTITGARWPGYAAILFMYILVSDGTPIKVTISPAFSSRCSRTPPAAWGRSPRQVRRCIVA